MQPYTNPLLSSLHDAVSSLFMWSWQTLFVLGSIWLIMKLHRSQPPAIRYKIWLFGVIATSTLPLLMATFHYFQVLRPDSKSLGYVAELPTTVVRQVIRDSEVANTGVLADSFRGMDQSAATPVWAETVWAVLFGAWVIGGFITLVRLCVSYWKLHGVRISARPVSFRELGIARLDRLATRATGISIGLSPMVQSPVLTGVIRPMILVPADIVTWTTVEERVSVLQHEIAHVQRLDHYANLFQSLLSTVFFFHPMFRYACRQLNVERELACDDVVLSQGTESAAYAESILKVVERSILPDVVHQPASFASRRTLERRLDMILKKERLPMVTRHWPFLVLPLALIATMIWLLSPGSSAKGVAGSVQNAPKTELVSRSAAEDENTGNKNSLIGSLAKNKAYDRLIDMALTDPDSGVRQHAYRSLLLIEGDGSTDALIQLYDRAKEAGTKEELIRYLGDRKAFGKLIAIAQSDSDLERRGRAVRRLTELEGDGSTAALLLLYKRSNDVGAKKLIIENLGERREFESLATLAKDEASPELRQAAIKQLELKKSSDTKDR